MEHEKYSYVDALKWLAKRYDVEIEETFATDEQRQQQQSAESLYIINNFAQQFLGVLFETEEGRDIGLSYLKERGFREDIIRKFQLGYNPEAKRCIYQRGTRQTVQYRVVDKNRLGCYSQ